MVNLFKDVEVGEESPKVVNGVIEIPHSSRNKYEVDHENGVLYLDRTLHTPLVYPFDYGFIPKTIAGDGDPLDIMVFSYQELVPKVVLKAKPVGVLKMKDEDGIDNKIFAVSVGEPRLSEIDSLEDVPEHIKREITHFFERYKDLENEKWTEVTGWEGKEKAHEIIKNSVEKFKEEYAD